MVAFFDANSPAVSLTVTEIVAFTALFATDVTVTVATPLPFASRIPTIPLVLLIITTLLLDVVHSKERSLALSGVTLAVIVNLSFFSIISCVLSNVIDFTLAQDAKPKERAITQTNNKTRIIFLVLIILLFFSLKYFYMIFIIEISLLYTSYHLMSILF